MEGHTILSHLPKEEELQYCCEDSKKESENKVEIVS